MDVDEDDQGTQRVKRVPDYGIEVDFDSLSDKLLEVGINSPEILKGIIHQVFEKALSEPKYVNMYAQLCRKISLSPQIPEFKEDTEDNKPIVCCTKFSA